MTAAKVIAEMTTTISEITKTQSLLEALGDRPDHETVNRAKQKVSEMESVLNNMIDEDWGLQGVPFAEMERMTGIEKERDMFKAVVQLDELHTEYVKLLKNAEKRLTKIYKSVAAAEVEGSAMDEGPSEEMSEEQHAAGRGIENVNLSGMRLKHLSEALGGIRGLVLLNLSNNHLQLFRFLGVQLRFLLSRDTTRQEKLPNLITLHPPKQIVLGNFSGLALLIDFLVTFKVNFGP